MKNLCSVLFATTISLALFSCGNSATKTGVANEPASPSAAGKDVYGRACASCHLPGGDGMAGVYPPLAKSDFLKDKEKTIGMVIKGGTEEIEVNGTKYHNLMPPQQLSDDEVAQVLNYIYSNFGNAPQQVTVAEVKNLRDKLK